MRRRLVLQQKLVIILVIAILTVCIGFIFISCGKGPQSKIANPDKGAFALDFTNCEGTTDICRGLLPVSLEGISPEKMVKDKDLTAEAWVKSKASSTSTFTGPIFGRFDIGGIILYVKNGFPKAAIRRTEFSGTGSATADHIVNSGVQILDNAWHHIAAVLTGEDHTGVHSECTSGTNTGTHLDIYVDGVYRNCNTSSYASEPGDVEVAPGQEPFPTYVSVGVFTEALPSPPGSFDAFTTNVRLPGIIDEARIWGSARTAAQINQCKNQELSLDNGTCGRLTSNCISYLRLNEGNGSIINDWCGLGTGVLERIGSGLHEWTNGWTTDTPDLTRTD